MTDRQPAFILFSDGTLEQVAPVSIEFIENTARGLADYAQRLKRQAVIAPPQPQEAESDVDTT